MNKIAISMSIALLFAANAFAADPQKATAVILPTAGNEAKGIITFETTPGGTLIKGQITGMAGGTHGIHIHEFGDCSAPDASSAGGHFNPENMKHGDPNSKEHHVGDLGNLLANPGEMTEISHVDKDITLSGKHSIIGRSVIIHANEDDLKTQPSGNSGSRIACGVVGIANTK